MKKNILSNIIAAIFIVMLGFSLLIAGVMKNPESMQRSSFTDQSAIYGKDQAELESFSEDLLLYGQDSNINLEIDETFNDILDLKNTALDERSISQEAANADLSGDLASLGTDYPVLSEIDQSLDEIVQ